MDDVGGEWKGRGKGRMDIGKYARYTPQPVEALERLYSECPKPSSMRRQQLIRECPILSNIEPKQIKVVAFETHGVYVLNPSLVGVLFPSSKQKRHITFSWLKLVKFLKLRKELVAEILELEKQKDEVEIELKKITTRLTVALTRLHKSREKRNQLDEANNQIVLHLKTKEDELSRSIS